MYDIITLFILIWLFLLIELTQLNINWIFKNAQPQLIIFLFMQYCFEVNFSELVCLTRTQVQNYIHIITYINKCIMFSFLGRFCMVYLTGIFFYRTYGLWSAKVFGFSLFESEIDYICIRKKLKCAWITILVFSHLKARLLKLYILNLLKYNIDKLCLHK